MADGPETHWATEAGEQDRKTLREWLEQPETSTRGRIAREAVFERELVTVWKGLVDSARSIIDTYNKEIGYDALKYEPFGADQFRLIRKIPKREVQIRLDRGNRVLRGATTNREGTPENRAWPLRIQNDELIIAWGTTKVDADEVIRSIFPVLRDLQEQGDAFKG